MIRRARRTSLLAAVLPAATALLPKIELCVHVTPKNDVRIVSYVSPRRWVDMRTTLRTPGDALQELYDGVVKELRKTGGTPPSGSISGVVTWYDPTSTWPEGLGDLPVVAVDPKGKDISGLVSSRCCQVAHTNVTGNAGKGTTVIVNRGESSERHRTTIFFGGRCRTSGWVLRHSRRSAAPLLGRYHLAASQGTRRCLC